MTVKESWRNVGQRIRNLRKANRLTLRQLAKGSGMSVNAISLVERGEVAPTVETLCKIASALGVSASYFFQEVCHNEVVVVRTRGVHSVLPADGVLQNLSCEAWAQDCGVVVGDLDFDDVDSPGFFKQTVLCLSGTVQCETNHKLYQLEAGDSMIFNGQVMQRWKNYGEEMAVAIVVFSPASGLCIEEGD